MNGSVYVHVQWFQPGGAPLPPGGILPYPRGMNTPAKILTVLYEYNTMCLYLIRTKRNDL